MNVLMPNVLIGILVVLGLKMRRESGSFFVLTQRQNRIVDVHQPIGISGNVASLDPHYVVLGVDPPDFQPPQIAPPVAHVAGQFGSRPDTGLLSTGTDVTGPAVSFRHTMRRRHSLEAVPFHNSLETMVNTENVSSCIRWSPNILYIQHCLLTFFLERPQRRQP